MDACKWKQFVNRVHNVNCFMLYALTNLMTFVPHFLYLRIIGILMGYVKCCLDGTSVRIFPVRCEYFRRIQIPIFEINRIIECQQYHLWHLTWFQSSRYQCSIFRTETFRQRTQWQVTRFGCIWIVFDVTPSFIWTIWTVYRTITKVLVW